MSQGDKKTEGQLLKAAREGNLDSVKQTIAKGVNVNCKDNVNCTHLVATPVVVLTTFSKRLHVFDIGILFCCSWVFHVLLLLISV